jgi:hypothetical protein
MYTRIKVVFADSQIKKTSNYVTYEVENFVFDIGGLIGLFLGSSLLTVMKLVIGVFRTIRDYIDRFKNVVKLGRERKIEEQMQNRRNRPASSSVATIYSHGQEIEELTVEDLE